MSLPPAGGAAAALPAALYARPEAFQHERRTVFQRAWLPIARAAAIAGPGDYVAQSIGGWPVFVIADRRGALAAFRNVCRHQGLPIFDTGAGRCEQIRCRYHGWTYDTGGGFIEAPPKVAPPDPADPMHRLEQVKVLVSEGLIFVYLGASPPADAGLGALAALGLGALEFRDETVTDIDANWKLVVEAALAMPPAGAKRELLWPVSILDATAGGAIVHQVIPRAFQRTRIHHLRFGAAPAADMNAVKTAAVAVHAACEQGNAPPSDGNAALADFRAGVAASRAG